MVHAHAAGALDQRLDDHRGDAVVMLGQGLFHDQEHVARMLFPTHAFRAQVAVRAGHLDGVQQQRLVGFGEQRHIAHRHRRDGLAVIAVGQGDITLLFRPAAVEPVVKAHLQRDFDAGRAIVGIEAAGQAFGRHLHQAFGQLDHRLMAEAGEDHMLQLIDLVLDTLVDARIAVAEHVDPPRTHGVEIAFAVEVFQPDAFAAPDRDQRQQFVIFHLGAGVPHDLEVAFHPLVVQAHFHSPTGGSRQARANNPQAYAMRGRGTTHWGIYPTRNRTMRSSGGGMDDFCDHGPGDSNKTACRAVLPERRP